MLLLIPLMYWQERCWVEQNHLEEFNLAQSSLFNPVYVEPTRFIGNDNMLGSWWFFVKILVSLLLALSSTL